MAKQKSQQPAVRDPIRTQEKILAAAQTEFARRGYDGARIDAIVARANISKNLLYHYFRGKEDLYIRILERAYETLRRRQGDVYVYDLDPLNAMILLCENTFRVFVEEPDVIIMLNTENLHRARHIGKSTIIRTMYDKLSENLRVVLNQGKEQGLFRKSIDPVELYISISALGYFYLSNQYTLSMLFNRKLNAPEWIAHRQAHLVDMVISYLTREPQPGDWTPELAR